MKPASGWLAEKYSLHDHVTASALTGITVPRAMKLQRNQGATMTEAIAPAASGARHRRVPD